MSSTLFCLGFIFGFIGSQSISSYIAKKKIEKLSEFKKVKPLLNMVIKTESEANSDSESYELGNYNYNTYKN